MNLSVNLSATANPDDIERVIADKNREVALLQQQIAELTSQLNSSRSKLSKSKPFPLDLEDQSDLRITENAIQNM